MPQPRELSIHNMSIRTYRNYTILYFSQPNLHHHMPSARKHEFAE